VACPSIAIIDGGISGLAAAYELAQRGVPFVLYERAARLGGVVLTELPEASIMGIPTRWLPFVTSGAFSAASKVRMAAELLVPGAPGRADESIASFIGRRFGGEAVEYLAEPLLAGIHGGDRAAIGRVLLRAFVGGIFNPAAVDLDDTALISATWRIPHGCSASGVSRNSRASIDGAMRRRSSRSGILT
jgi:protoporphyrinogen oxidase